MKQLNHLLKPYQLTKQLSLTNKIIMAPMTRAQAHKDGSATDAMADYYAKRADAGLIITEGTIIHPDASGYDNVPGIFTDKHVETWKIVSNAVHKKGGRIFMQIWHVGRVSHPSFLNGKLPISASATTMKERVRRTQNLYYGKSRATTIAEIKKLIQQYANAAHNAIKAGFDGVEIHAANGYLIDQFLHYNTNLRDDEYGGTAKNMSRFALEVVNACADAIGYERVGIRLPPGAYLNEIVGDMLDYKVFSHLLTKLNELPIAYVHTGNFDDNATFKELGELTMTQFIKKYYKGNIIASGSYNATSAEHAISNGDFDLVSIGRPFIANPNLMKQLREQKPLAAYDASMLDTLN